MQNPGRLQTTGIRLELFHVQTDTSFELPPNFAIIRFGKPKNQYIPEIDVSDLPNADFVSRLHAEIQVKESTYYLVDVGSSNGTYLNNMKLEPRKLYPLNIGDKIDLGSGSKVTFLFQHKQNVVFESDTKLNNQPTVLQIELYANPEQAQIAHLSKLVGKICKILNNSLRSLKELLKK